jgi:hypothetical protein
MTPEKLREMDEAFRRWSKLPLVRVADFIKPGEARDNPEVARKLSQLITANGQMCYLESRIHKLEARLMRLGPRLVVHV